MRLIVSSKFDYINLHYHFFCSYHGEGTDNTMGGHGNFAAVKKTFGVRYGCVYYKPLRQGRNALSSFYDYRAPGWRQADSDCLCRAAWMVNCLGVHTTSVGVARPSDLNEVLEAARIYSNLSKKSSGELSLLSTVEQRVKKQMEIVLGLEWMKKRMLNIPTCYDESTKGIAIGHILFQRLVCTIFAERATKC